MVALILISSCKKTSTNEQELITTVKISLTTNGKTVVAQWKDTDGAGGNNPTIDTLLLDTNTTYIGSIEVYDESKSPVVNITDEITKEKNDHQFFYSSQGALTGNLDISVTDKDDNSLPIGLQYSATTKSQSKIGTLRIVLSHYDGVAKSTSQSSESDIDIEIPVKIK